MEIDINLSPGLTPYLFTYLSFSVQYLYSVVILSKYETSAFNLPL